MPIPENWSTMTDEQKRAWADSQTAPQGPSQKPAPQAPSSTGSSVEDEIAEIYARKGGYLRSPRGDGDTHTEHR